MRRLAAAMVATSLVLAACGGKRPASSAGSTPHPTTGVAAGTVGSRAPSIRPAPSGAAFYEPPQPLRAGRPGTVIWAAAVAGPAGMRTWRVLYHSRSVAGRDIAVSGLVFAPAQTTAATGVVSYAHGTTGIGDQCAPSQHPDNGELAQIAAAVVPLGLVMAATDYEGLGTPGVHPYLVGESEGRGVLDAVAAARAVVGAADPGRVVPQGPAVVWGHSQGGGAALFAAELAPVYAPGARVVGAVAGAPASELKLLGAALRHSPFFGFTIMTAAGLKAAYPDLDLGRVLTPKGVEEAQRAGTSCYEVLTDLANANPDDYVRADPVSDPEVARLLERNTPGNTPTSVPIFVYHGEADELIPVASSALLLARMCRTGGYTVLRTTYPGARHTTVIAAATSDIKTWIEDRLAGRPAPTTPCPPG